MSESTSPPTAPSASSASPAASPTATPPASPLKRWVTGDLSRHVLLKRVFPVAAGVFAFLLLLSYLLTPADFSRYGPYSIFHNPISSLGHHRENPVGWLFFSLALAWIGCAIFPVGPYVYRRLAPVCRKTAALGLFFAVAASVGMVLIAFFPAMDDPLWGSQTTTIEDIHNVAAALAFGGWFLAALIWWGPQIKDNIPRWGGSKQVPLAHVLGSMALLLFAALGTGISQLYVSLNDLHSMDAGFLSWPFWEWTLLVALMGYIFWLVALLPAEFQDPGARETGGTA